MEQHPTRIETNSDVKVQIESLPSTHLDAVEAQWPSLPELEFTEHQQAVLEIMRNMILDYYNWEQSAGLPGLLDENTVNRIINRLLPEQFSNMVTRHIVGIQPMTSPTALAFIKNGFTQEKMERRIDQLVECGFSREDASRTMLCETIQDLRWGAQHQNSKLKGMNRLEEPTEIEKLEKVTCCSATRTFNSPEELSAMLDREILRTLAYIATPAGWEALTAFENPVIYAHPNNAAILPPGLKVIFTEQMSENIVLVGCKHDEYHAPLYYMPYIGLYGKKTEQGTEYKTRYALVAAPNRDWTKTIKESSDLVYSISVK